MKPEKENKYCIWCKKNKPLNDFYIDQRYNYFNDASYHTKRYKSICKECRRKKDKERYKNKLLKYGK